ncbi:MAG: acetylglutamate kinase, partial [Thermodesulfobacteriota bacterium]
VLDKDGSLIPTINSTEAGELIEKGVISGGMIPKIKCCLDSLSNGVSKTHVIDGRIEHAVLLEIFTDAGIGTEILNK